MRAQWLDGDESLGVAKRDVPGSRRSGREKQFEMRAFIGQSATRRRSLLPPVSHRASPMAGAIG